MINRNEKTNWQLLGTNYRPIKYSCMDKTCLGHKLLVYVNGMFEGIVTSITMSGVGIETDSGFRFVKWCNVVENLSI